MNNRFAILALFAVSITANFAFAGSETRNGSDVVVCASQEPISLDYVLESKEKKLEIVNLDLNNSLQRIAILIAQKVPRLSNSFKEYVAELNNTQNIAKKYTWVPQTDRLPDLLDEQIKKFPTWCNFISDAASIEQIVIRVTRINRSGGPSRVTFLYNADLFKQLNPTQKSFILVHEWLWNHTNQAKVVRKINYFLHSTLFDKMSPVDVSFYLQKNGIRFADGLEGTEP